MLKTIERIWGELILTLAFGLIMLRTDFNDDSVGEWLYYVFGIYGVLMIIPSAVKYWLRSKA